VGDRDLLKKSRENWFWGSVLNGNKKIKRKVMKMRVKVAVKRENGFVQKMGGVWVGLITRK
jgi:hypothetical protein